MCLAGMPPVDCSQRLPTTRAAWPAPSGGSSVRLLPSDQIVDRACRQVLGFLLAEEPVAERRPAFMDAELQEVLQRIDARSGDIGVGGEVIRGV
jgi:hypothetical protein